MRYVDEVTRSGVGRGVCDLMVRSACRTTPDPVSYDLAGTSLLSIRARLCAMPIRTLQRYVEPVDWPQLSQVIPFGRANGWCGRPDGAYVRRRSRHAVAGRRGFRWDAGRGRWRRAAGPFPTASCPRPGSCRGFPQRAQRGHAGEHPVRDRRLREFAARAAGRDGDGVGTCGRARGRSRQYAAHGRASRGGIRSDGTVPVRMSGGRQGRSAWNSSLWKAKTSNNSSTSRNSSASECDDVRPNRTAARDPPVIAIVPCRGLLTAATHTVSPFSQTFSGLEKANQAIHKVRCALFGGCRSSRVVLHPDSARAFADARVPCPRWYRLARAPLDPCAHHGLQDEAPGCPLVDDSSANLPAWRTTRDIHHRMHRVPHPTPDDARPPDPSPS